MSGATEKPLWWNKAAGYASLSAGIVAVVFSAAMATQYIRVTAPGVFDEIAVHIEGVVTGQRVTTKGWIQSYVPDVALQYFETFTFIGPDAQPQAGEDEVTSPYFEAHPIGAPVDVYYDPTRIESAVLDAPIRLSEVPSRQFGGALLLSLCAGLWGLAFGTDSLRIASGRSRLF